MQQIATASLPMAAARPSSKSPRHMDDSKRTSIKELFSAVFRALQTDGNTIVPSKNLSGKPPSPGLVLQSDIKVLLPCLIVYYPQYISASDLISIAKREVYKGTKPVGALRFLCSWVRARYSRDFRGKRHLVRALCKLAMYKDVNASEEVTLELNRLKLALIGGAPPSVWTQRRGTSLAISPHVMAAVSLPAAVESDRGHKRRTVKDKAGVNTTTTPIPFAPPNPKDSSVKTLMAFSSPEIAHHLLHLNFRPFSAIQLPEFNVKSTEHAQTLNVFKNRCKLITSWVASVILVQKDLDLMRKVACKFIEIAKFCLVNGDLASCSCIMQAFGNNCVNRLQKKWHIRPNLLALAKECDAIVMAENNYSNQRAEIRKRIKEGNPCVVHLAMYQKDLTFIHDGNPDYRPDGSVNVDKIVLIGTSLWEISQCQSNTPKGHSEFGSTCNPLLASMLTVLPSRREDELERLSNLHKPRAATPEDTKPHTEDSSSTVSAGDATMAASNSTAITATNVNEESSSTRSDDFVDV